MCNIWGCRVLRRPFLPYRKVRHNVVRCQQEFVEQILAKLAAGPTFLFYRKFLHLSEFAGGKSHRQAKLVFCCIGKSSVRILMNS